MLFFCSVHAEQILLGVSRRGLQSKEVSPSWDSNPYILITKHPNYWAVLSRARPCHSGHAVRPAMRTGETRAHARKHCPFPRFDRRNPMSRNVLNFHRPFPNSPANRSIFSFCLLITGFNSSNYKKNPFIPRPAASFPEISSNQINSRRTSHNDKQEHFKPRSVSPAPDCRNYQPCVRTSICPLKFAKPLALTIRLSFAPLKAFSRPTGITGQVMNSLVIFNCKMLIRVIHSLI
jgi:hypothetical protein